MTDVFHYARLVGMHADVRKSEILLEAEAYVLGRLPEVCDIVIERPTVSRIHARIERHGSHYELHNLSRNKTYVNGIAIEHGYILQDRDAIGLASVEPLLRFLDFDPTIAVVQRLRYDDQTLRFFLDEQPLNLTPLQLRLLQYLYQHSGQVCGREECEQAVWGDDPVLETNALHRLVSDIRGEFRRIDPGAELIETRRGLGYVLNL
jgi:DNA-binding response OmpR family regulator